MSGNRTAMSSTKGRRSRGARAFALILTGRTPIAAHYHAVPAMGVAGFEPACSGTRHSPLRDNPPVSQQNILLVRAGYEAWNSEGLEAIMPAFDPEIEWHSPFPEEASFKGHEGVRKWFKSLTDVWAELQFHPDSYVDEGDDVLVRLRVRGLAKASGIEVEMPLTQRWTIRDGRAVTMNLTVDAADAPLRVKTRGEGT